MRTQAEWKVRAQMSLARSPSMASRRALSSSAALLVKVMAMMRQGSTGSYAARRRASSEGPASSTARSASVALSGTSSVSEARPYLSRFATLFISTVVLPLPAPARTSRGPSVASTASLCMGLSFAKSASTTRFRAAIYRFSKSLSIAAIFYHIKSSRTTPQADEKRPNPAFSSAAHLCASHKYVKYIKFWEFSRKRRKFVQHAGYAAKRGK